MLFGFPVQMSWEVGRRSCCDRWRETMFPKRVIFHTQETMDSASTQSALGPILLSFLCTRCLSFVLNKYVSYPSSIREGPTRKQWLYRNIWISLIHSTITAVISVVRYGLLSSYFYFSFEWYVCVLFRKSWWCVCSVFLICCSFQMSPCKPNIFRYSLAFSTNLAC